MAFIISYRPITTEFATRRPEAWADDGASLIEDLAQIDGVVYATAADAVDISSFDPAFMCEQPELTPALRAEIKRRSPRCQLIKRRAEARKTERYPIEDRLALAEIDAGMRNGFIAATPERKAALAAYAEFIISVNAETAQQYAALGL